MASYTQKDIQLMARAFAREKKKASQLDTLNTLLIVSKQKEKEKKAEIEQENQLLSEQISSLKKFLKKQPDATKEQHLEEELVREKQLSEKFKNHLFALKQQHDQALSELQEKDRVSELKRELEEENQLLGQQLAALKGNYKQLQGTQEEQFQVLETDLQEALKEKVEAQSKLFDLEARLQAPSDNQDRILSLETRLQAIQKEKVDLENKLEAPSPDIQDRILNLEKSLQESHEAAQFNQDKILSLETRLQVSQKENSELRERIQQVQAGSGPHGIDLETYQRLLNQEEQFKNAAEHQSLLEQELELEAERQHLLKQDLEKLRLSKEESERVLQETKKHAQQLERVIQFLRERSDGTNVELQQVRAEFESLQENFNNADEQLKAARTENEQLDKKFHAEVSVRQEKDAELKTQQAQQDDLRKAFALQRNELQSEQQKNGVLHETVGKSEKLLQAQENRLEAYMGELTRIKQTLLRSVRESQELQAHYQAVVAEKIALLGKWRQSQFQLEKERQQLALLEEKLEKASSVRTELCEQVAHWQQQCAQDKQQVSQVTNLVKQREDTILDLQRQVGLLRHEGEKVRDELSQISEANASREKELHEARAHVTRKVKEVAELEISSEMKQRQIEEFRKSHQEDKIRIAELQANCEMYQAQQHRMQEQLQEAIKAYENQQGKWEDKYLTVYDKWQNAEARTKELEKLEERYNQLQGLFSNMGNFLHTAPTTPENSPAPKDTPKETLKETPKAFSNLFDLPKPAARPKSNLLDP